MEQFIEVLNKMLARCNLNNYNVNTNHMCIREHNNYERNNYCQKSALKLHFGYIQPAAIK